MSGSTEDPVPGSRPEKRRQADPVLLAADAKAWETVAAARFAGPLYDKLVDRTIRHALPIMRRALASGAIFRWCADRNSQIKLWAPHDWCESDQNEVALETVAAAAFRFHAAALAGNGWSGQGGATLSTYFLGLCIDAFPNQFRAWLRARQQARRQTEVVGDPAAQVASPPGHDPPTAVEVSDELRHRLGRLPLDQREAVLLQAVGYTVREIAVRTNSTVKAVEGRIYRGRQRLKRDSEEVQ
jgi:DNA-directed RNA polymerase specialized sigma24 family protein